MKCKKIAVLLGLSVCLIATNTQLTYGLEAATGQVSEAGAKESGQNSLVVENAIQETGMVVPVTPEIPKADPIGQETDHQEPSNSSEENIGVSGGVQETPETDSSTGEVPNEDTKNDVTDEVQKDDTSDEEKKDDASDEEQKDDTSDEEKKDDASNEDQKDDTSDEEKKDDASNEDQKDDTSEEDKKDDVTDEEQKDDNQGEDQNKAPSNEQPSAGEAGSGNQENTDNSGSQDNSDSVTVTPDIVNNNRVLEYNALENRKPDVTPYRTNRILKKNENKVKYDVKAPIEDLPGFITQEMIVGALKCQDETGYPASVTIAQIIQESGFGEYGTGLSYLAYEYNNLFGIKGTGPAGSVDMLTGEQTAAGEDYTITAGFRVYHTYTECIEDRTKLLDEVYSDLTEGVTDANTFAMQVGSRWATSLTYGESLIYQMEKYDLYRLDEMTVKEFSDMIGTFADPCPGATVSSTFGYRDFDKSFHKGLDLGTGQYNLPTYAADAGTVVTAGWSDSAGNWIVIAHGNGLVTKYMHHEEIYVKEGQHVEKGQQIGLSGTTGYSTGNHLHFQVEKDGKAVNPEVYLAKDEEKTTDKK